MHNVLPNYVGSWAEWDNDPRLPIKATVAPAAA